MKKTILLVCGLFTILNLSHAQYVPTQIPTVEVEGNSEIMVIPDEAVLNITVQKKSMTVAQVTKELNAATKKLVDAFKQSGLRSYDLTTGNYIVNINRIYQKGSAKDSGYVASQNIEITVKDLEHELAKAVEMVNVSGDQSLRVDFRLSREKEKSYKDQLMESALKDALEKAGSIANIMGLKDIKVFKVQYSSGQGSGPIYQMKASNMRFESADMREDPIFMPEEQKLTDRVLVTFTFENE